jgi:hypothetical protein
MATAAESVGPIDLPHVAVVFEELRMSSDWSDPYTTAADCIAAARKAAPVLRDDLPRLLGRRVLPAAHMLAEKFERGNVLDDFCRTTLGAIVAQCDLAIAQGTEEKIMLQQTGWGPAGPIYSPELTIVRTDNAAEQFRIRQPLEAVQRAMDRTVDLLAAEDAVWRMRT